MDKHYEFYYDNTTNSSGLLIASFMSTNEFNKSVFIIIKTLIFISTSYNAISQAQGREDRKVFRAVSYPNYCFKLCRLSFLFKNVILKHVEH